MESLLVAVSFLDSVSEAFGQPAELNPRAPLDGPSPGSPSSLSRGDELQPRKE